MYLASDKLNRALTTAVCVFSCCYHSYHHRLATQCKTLKMMMRVETERMQKTRGDERHVSSLTVSSEQLTCELLAMFESCGVTG